MSEDDEEDEDEDEADVEDDEALLPVDEKRSADMKSIDDPWLCWLP